MAARVKQALFMAVALGGWVLYQVLFRKKTGAEINDEVMFIAFFAAVWLILSFLLW